MAKLLTREQALDKLLSTYTPVTESGCWLWIGGENGKGYGRMRWGKNYRAHRLAYELLRGPIPSGLELDHLCRVKCCINPDHLEIVTSKVNTLRGTGPTAQNAIRTHCVNGHEFTLENTRIGTDGDRVCRACRRDTWHRRKHKARPHHYRNQIQVRHG